MRFRVRAMEKNAIAAVMASLGCISVWPMALMLKVAVIRARNGSTFAEPRAGGMSGLVELAPVESREGETVARAGRVRLVEIAGGTVVWAAVGAGVPTGTKPGREASAAGI